MLTTKDHIWLKNRERRLAIGHPYYSCAHCSYWQGDEKHECASWGSCIDEEGFRDDCFECQVLGGLFDNDDSLITGYDYGPSFRDATEFEARVAKLLSNPDAIERLLVCWDWPEEKLPCENDKDADCRRCRLKVARLLAEEEMDR